MSFGQKGEPPAGPDAPALRQFRRRAISRPRFKTRPTRVGSRSAAGTALPPTALTRKCRDSVKCPKNLSSLNVKNSSSISLISNNLICDTVNDFIGLQICQNNHHNSAHSVFVILE